MRNLLLETVSGVENEFDISCGYTWHGSENASNPDDNVVRVQNDVTGVSGTISAFWYGIYGIPMRCHPVSARIVLRQGGTELQSAAFSDVYKRQGRKQGGNSGIRIKLTFE